MGEIINCPYCGTKLMKTNYDRDWCPNCGIIEDMNKTIESEESDEKPSYIG